MENINKIIAITLDRRSKDGNGGNCKVIGIESNNFYITDPVEIYDIFNTSGIIFSNKIYEYGIDIDINDLIEIIPSKINFDIEENRNIYVGIKQVNKIGTPVIDVPSEYLTDDYLDLENITNFCNSKNLIHEHITRLYLCDHNEIFGPLKYENNKISPIKGKATNAFEYHIEELIEDDLLPHLYLLKEPRVKIKTVDCSTTAQLVEFLKDRIFIDRADLNLILKVDQEILSINNKESGLDLIRLKRAERYLNQLKLSFEQLQKLGQNNDWAKVVKNCINLHREEFEKEVLGKLHSKLDVLEKEIETKNKELVLVNELVEREQYELSELQNQIQILESKKDEIISLIRIMANIQQPTIASIVDSNKTPEDSISVELLSHLSGSAIYTDLDDFYQQLTDKYNFHVKNQDKYEDGLILLKESRFLLAKSTDYVLNLLSHVGNAKIAIQHAEADWLKFKYWKDNGLLSVIKQATIDEDQHYFYVLQDFNIASFECYGKPMLDVSNRFRTTVDGVHTLPSNFTIILIRTDEEIDDFGFELNKSTFKNWKCLPNVSSINLIKFPIHELIDLNNMSFNRDSQDYSDQYF